MWQMLRENHELFDMLNISICIWLVVTSKRAIICITQQPQQTKFRAKHIRKELEKAVLIELEPQK